MSYAQLKALTDAAPAGLTDAELVDWCNEAQTRWRHIDQLPLLGWCAKNNIISKLRTESGLPTSTTTQAFSDVLLVLINGAGLDATNSEIRTLMGTLRAEGVISQAELDELIVLGQTSITRAQKQIGWPGLVTIHDITHVRSL